MTASRVRPRSIGRALVGGAVLVVSTAVVAALAPPGPAAEVPLGPGGLAVLAYNDLGMHCMNEEFSELVILPPYNTVRSQVIRRGIEPDILSGNDATVRYVVPTNTRSADKANFWAFDQALFGVDLPPDVGLTGHGLSGTMTAHEVPKHYEVTGIPLNPIDDAGRPDPYPLAVIEAVSETGLTGSTVTVVPVSTEISCNLCHDAPGISTATDILRAHDTLHGTDLENQKPVLCAACHSDNALGAPGQPGLSSLSAAMHTAHAPRMDMIDLSNECYGCHPGIRTQCQRDVHFVNGIDCIECHGDMIAVGDPARQPWIEEPRCDGCHTVPGFQFEQPNTLYRNSIGHKGVLCASCHGSPHAITTTSTPVDNQQAILLQGHAGVIDTCTVCHTVTPGEPFFHKVDN